MTLIRKWALALCLVLLCSNYSNAQVDPVTGNLINSGNTPTDTTSTWNNGVYVNQLCFHAGEPGNCGPRPSIRDGGNINFSYGQTDLNQIININRALAAGGSGVQLSGFNFGFRAKNGNGWDDGRQDYLDAYVKFYNAGGGVAATYDYASQTNAKYNWTNFNFSETFANPIAATNYSHAQVGFIGKDNNFWAGNYGPEITNVSFNLKYRVDPCSTNPAYAPTCAGFNSVVTSGNLLPNPNAMSNGNAVINTFAVNTALKNSGAGVEIYGFNYGYNYSLGNGTYGCTATNSDGSCSWYMTTNPTAQVRVRLTDNNNDVIYSAIQSRSTPNTAENVSYQFLLPSTTNSMALGNFSLGASTSGNAAIQNMYANALYKPDPCVDPLYNASCPGYGAAFAAKLNSSTSITPTAKTAGALVVTTESAATSSTPVVNVGGAQLSTTGAISAPDNIPQMIKDVQAVTQQSQTSAPQANNVQQSNKSTPNMSLIINLISQIQTADKATQAAAVQNAQQVAATSAAKAQEQAMATVDILNAMSMAGSQAAQDRAIQSSQASISMPQSSTTVSSAPLQAPTTMSLQSLMTMSVQAVSSTPSTTMPVEQIYQPVVNTPSVFSMAAAYTASKSSNVTYNEQQLSSLLAIQQPVAETTPVQFAKIESRPLDADTPVMPVMTSMPRGSSVTEIAEVRTNIETNQTEQQTETVKKNVQPNELAGGVDIASIATQPKGFDVYATTILKDGAFYAPKDIYGNQKTIDNARALRSLSSDRLHQDMIDLQYRR
jgi:hypothetical protein